MADLDLRTDYKDDILDSSVNEKRKYNIIDNEDGTKSLEDVSEYAQRGDSFGAVDINKTNQAVLDLNQSLTLDFSNASEDVQDLNTLLQNLLDKFYPYVEPTTTIRLTLSNTKLTEDSYLEITPNDDGTVTLSGEITSTEIQTGTPTLVSSGGIPTEYRPKSTVTFTVTQTEGTERTMTINTNGSVTITAMSTNGLIVVNKTYSV